MAQSAKHAQAKPKLKTRPVQIEIPLPSKPKRLYGSQCLPPPDVSIVPPRDTTAYIVSKMVMPPPLPPNYDTKKYIEALGVQRKLYYTIGWTDLPAAKVIVRATRILDYVSPRELEDWEYKEFLAAEEDKERRNNTATPPVVTKTKGKRGRPRKGPAALELELVEQEESMPPTEDELLRAGKKAAEPSLSTPSKSRLAQLFEVQDSEDETSENDALTRQLNGVDAAEPLYTEDEEALEGDGMEVDSDIPRAQTFGFVGDTDSSRASSLALVPDTLRRPSPVIKAAPKETPVPLPTLKFNESVANTTPRVPPSSMGTPTQKPVLQMPVLQMPALQKPALQKPVLQKPVLQKPVLQNPVATPVPVPQIPQPTRARPPTTASSSPSGSMNLIPSAEYYQTSQETGKKKAKHEKKRKHEATPGSTPQSVAASIGATPPAPPPKSVKKAKTAAPKAPNPNPNNIPLSQPMNGSRQPKSTPQPMDPPPPRRTTDFTPVQVSSQTPKPATSSSSAAKPPTSQPKSEPQPQRPSQPPPKKRKTKAPPKPEPEEDAWEVLRLEGDKEDYDTRGILTRFFRVRWKGDWPDDQNPTWEPEANISTELVTDYLKKKKEKDAQAGKMNGHGGTPAQPVPASKKKKRGEEPRAWLPKKRYSNVAEAFEGELEESFATGHGGKEDDEEDGEERFVF